KKPVDVAGAVKFITGLLPIQQMGLREEPGVYLMFTDSGLSTADTGKLLAASRSNDPDYNVPGSEGTHHQEKQTLKAALPVSFTASEARITIRFNIDTHLLPSDYKLESSRIEDWTAAIDDAWNHKYRVRSDTTSLALVFAPYMAVGIGQPDKVIVLENAQGRSRAGKGYMHLYLKGKAGESELNPSTVAHEFGHVLGNPDEYNLVPADYPRFAGKPAEQPPVRGGQSAETIMGDSSLSNVEDRHVGAAVEIINDVRDTQKYPQRFKLEKG
ncbi:MAG TPA: hypothetical protein VIW92_14810, partial [Thermoanaerobaculia bacterium]